MTARTGGQPPAGGEGSAGGAPAEDVVVIGAGPAGLATSACLRRAGLRHLVLDRAPDVASSWRRHYERLRLHTVKQHSALPFAPWPADVPRFPGRDDLIAYLERYATEHRVAPRFGVEVHHLSRTGDRFRLATSAGPLAPRFVVVATGLSTVPWSPALPGLSRFDGPVLHSRDYRNAAALRGHRAIVVGCGNSGAEIALDLVEHGVEAAMVVRGPVHVMPRDLWGRSAQETAILLARVPLLLRDAAASMVGRLAVGDLSRWGLRRPGIGLNRSIEQLGRIPLIDIGTIAAIRAGRLRVLPAIARVEPDAVVLADGTRQPAGALVLATGYRCGLEPWIDGFAAIADQRGRPLDVETSVPNLFFVGFRTRATGALREIALEAPRVATAIRQRI